MNETYGILNVFLSRFEWGWAVWDSENDDEEGIDGLFTTKGRAEGYVSTVYAADDREGVLVIPAIMPATGEGSGVRITEAELAALGECARLSEREARVQP